MRERLLLIHLHFTHPRSTCVRIIIGSGKSRAAMGLYKYLGRIPHDGHVLYACPSCV